MSLVAAIYRQFAKPEGLPGRIVGWIMATRGSNRRRNLWTVELLALKPTDRVLEIGFGPGLAIAAAARQVPQGKVVGVDHSALMCAQASARNAAFIQDGRVTLRQAGVEQLPEIGGPFDKAFSVNVFQFFEDRRAALAIVRRVMAPDGVFAVTYMPRHRNAVPADADRFAAALAEDMAATGFRRVRIEKLALKPMPAVCVLGSA
jgi:ubiquinone/menaquinone biosynthesis C-methylase UbiE